MNEGRRSWWRRRQRKAEAEPVNGASIAAMMARFTCVEDNVRDLLRAQLTVLESHQAFLETIHETTRRMERKMDALLQAVTDFEAVSSSVAAKLSDLKSKQSDPAALDALAARVTAAVKVLSDAAA